MANNTLNLCWEDVQHNLAGYLYRAIVPGGWLVKFSEDVLRHERNEVGHTRQTSITFIPDPSHSWGLRSVAYEFDAWCDQVQENIQKVTPHFYINWKDLKPDYMAGLSPEGAAAKFLMK